MIIIKDKVFIAELKRIAQELFGNLVKAVIDVKERIMVVGGELHADEEAFLLERGSKQENLWGINLYPEVNGDDWIEFDSLINIRPFRGNRTRGIDDPAIRAKIIEIINLLVER